MSTTTLNDTNSAAWEAENDARMADACAAALAPAASTIADLLDDGEDA